MLCSAKTLKQCKLFLKNIYETILYRFTRRINAFESPKKIVFVCRGNICRSAFAEHLMKAQTKGASLSIESCGLNVEVRTPAPLEAKVTAKKFGLDLERHLSKGCEYCDLENADLILAMEYWQYRKLVEILPFKKEDIVLLRDFAPFPEKLLCNIYDPYGQKEETYERCFRQIKRSILTITARM